MRSSPDRHGAFQATSERVWVQRLAALDALAVAETAMADTFSRLAPNERRSRISANARAVAIEARVIAEHLRAIGQE